MLRRQFLSASSGIFGGVFSLSDNPPRREKPLRAAAALFVLSLCSVAVAAPPLEVSIAYLSRNTAALPPLSPLDLPAKDDGLAGALLGVADNNTTGAFLGHRYRLSATTAAAAEGLAPPPNARLIIADLPAGDLRAAAAAYPQALFFNVRAEEDSLRAADCADNIFHVVPSYAMRADALAQYLAWKNWRKWLLLRGELPADIAWARALARAAQKFGMEIVETRVYAYEATTRRTDSGHMQIQKQLPDFIRDAAAHDVLIAADESHVFAGYLPYRMWAPRPVAGSAGLRALAWHAASEQWGATQLQRRFRKAAGRWMRERDYLAWLAARIIGEAVTRGPQNRLESLRDYLVDDGFSVAGFKGQALTFRTWNQQLRQPLFLVGARMIVSVSPQPAFLHERSPLDTLGLDIQESACRLQAARQN